MVETSHVPATSGTTLLPRPVASLVSLLTQSTSLSLRVGTFFGGVALDGACATTLTGLELGRAVVEGILTRAGRDVAIRSGDDHGRMEADSLLERSLATLHTTVTSASFFAAATFHFSSTTLASVANFSQALLSTLDAILGSTESSRAIAAIITLIRREFRPVESGADAEKVGVGDLFIGSVSFALLQRWGKKNTERRLRDNGGVEVVWDMVILDDGARADVVGTNQVQCPDRSQDAVAEPESTSFVTPGSGDGAFGAVHRRSSTADTFGGSRSRLSLPLNGNEQASDEEIRSHIMRQLPQGCHASIRSEVLTARTITVDIFDDDMAEIAAPPGTTMIEERFHHDHGYAGSDVPEYQRLPRHTVVFRTALSKSQSTQLRPHDAPPTSSPVVSEHVHRALSPAPWSPGQSRSQHNRLGSHQDSASEVTITQPNASSPESQGAHGRKPPVGKGPFTKFARKVKPNVPEKSEDPKRPSQKKPTLKTPGSSGTATARQSVRPSKGTASVKDATARESSSRVDSKKRPSETTDYRPTTPAPNRGLRRSPYPTSPQSSRSHAQHIPRDVPDRRSSRAGYFAVREKSQESLLTHTDAFSRRTTDFRSGSPTTSRTHVRSSSSISVAHSEADGAVSVNDHRPGSSALHRRSHSFTPSMYSVATAGSETSLLLAHRPRKSVYEDSATMQALHRDGFIPGMFPERHLVQNIRRFCRFASASYGASALKVMGVPRGITSLPHSTSDSHEHSAFSDHAGLPPSTILLSSFFDPAGGSNAAGETESGFPLVHYLSLDHDSKAVVLTLRGTWGFEDILTDMTCDYDDLEWQGRNWKVHKGMHASAKRLLEGGGGRVMITLRAALEEFQDYGVVLCGHSLGGGVAALLATMISMPSNTPAGTSFVTASYHPTAGPPLLPMDTETSHNASPPSPPPSYDLPCGRPIHVFAYGPPAVMSPFLRLATRGLVTTVVNGTDVVPSLSLGILQDMHTASLAFKSDVSGAKSQIRRRLHETLRQSIIHKFYVHQPPLVVNAGDGVGEDAWAWRTLQLLRDEMRAPKLMPPGEVFVVGTTRVLQREAFPPAPEPAGADGYPRLGRPATRVQLRFIRDVDAWFGELRFEGGMLTDHNPARYETSLAALARGVLDG